MSWLINISYALSPFIQTKISVSRDGWVPFDAATYNGTSNFGQDATATNWVVRVTDLIRYKVEVAINDTDASAWATSVITLDPGNTWAARQNWTSIPTDCLSWSSISTDKQTLTCKLSIYREGSNVVFYPEARATQVNRNGDTVHASVSSTAPWANTAVSWPTSVVTTAGFWVDLVKTLKPPYKNTSWDIIYTPDANVDINGNPWGTWYMVTYRISADYLPGSASVSGDINNKVSYTLSDTFQYFSGYLGTWARFAGCSLLNTTGTVTCPSVGSSVFTAWTSRTFAINVNNINVLTPVDGTKVFALDIKYWIPNTDIRTDGVPLTNRNDVVFNWWSHVWANLQPISNDNASNPNESTANNGMDYLLYRLIPGGDFRFVKSFRWYLWPQPKNWFKKVFPWEVIKNEMQLYNTRIVWKNSFYGCDNIDTTKFEFMWIPDWPQPSTYNYFDANSSSNPHIGIFDTISWRGLDKDPNRNGLEHYLEYSNKPHTINTSSSSPQRDSTCEDDLDNNGSYDWVSDPSLLVWWTWSVTKVRIWIKYDTSQIKQDRPLARDLLFGVSMNLKVKETVPVWTKIANFGNSAIGWTDKTKRRDIVGISNDPLDPNFSLHYDLADRVTVVWAKAWITKSVTTPNGSSIIQPGDSLTYTISPSINWWYIPANGTVPIWITDTLPTTQTLVSWTGVNCGISTISLASAPTANSLVWKLTGSVGQPLCQIVYTVKVADSAWAWDYVNTARIDVCDPALGNDCGILDKDVDADGNDTIPIKAVAWVSIIKQWVAFDVKKDAPEFYKQVNTPFSFDLSYANLGLEDLDGGQLIDILPYNGDKVMTGTSGPNTSRRPGTAMSGSFELTSISNVNGEYQLEVTNGDPHLIVNEANHPNTAVTWTACSNFANPSSCLTGITAFRLRFPTVAANTPRKNISIVLTPTGNASGNIYTNSFSAYTPSMSFPVISNDVSVQVVAGSIGDTVWYDTNSNGMIDSGEQLLPGIPVTLKNSWGTVVATGITNASGQYLFTNLPSGTYSIDITKPAAWSHTYDLDSGTGNLAALNGSTAITIGTVRDFVTNALQSVTSNLSWDFGLVGPDSSVWGTIYWDKDRTKISNSNIALSGQLVTLQGTDLWGRSITLTWLTDTQWEYLFTGLKGWTWSVSYVNSSSLLPDSAQTGFDVVWCVGYTTNPGTLFNRTCGGSPIGQVDTIQKISNITIDYGQNSIINNFWLITPWSINWTVWYDMDANQSTWSESYTSWAKLVVTYTNPIEGTVTTTVYTDANGNWSVGGIQTGSTYTVSLDTAYGPANGYRVTTNNVSYNGSIWYAQTVHVWDQWLYLTNVKVSKAVDVTDATLWDVITYTINYINDSSGTAYNVSVYDLFPFDFLHLDSSTPVPTSPSSLTTLVTPTTLSYSIGTLTPGQTWSIVITATVTAGTDAQIIANLGAIDTAGTWYVTGSTLTVTTGSVTTNTTGTTETMTWDNTSTALITIYRIDLGVVKDVDRTIVWPNDVFEYTLHLSNATGTVSKIVVVDTLDPNLVYVSMGSGTITSNPVVSGQSLTWSWITLAQHSSSTIKILVKPKQYLPSGITLNNNATIGRYNNLGVLIPLYELDSSNNVSSAQVTLSGTNYASIAGHVYFDENSSSGFDARDVYQGWVVVHLLSWSSVIATTSTNASGYYYFANLVAGSYEVQYEVPGWYHSYTSLGWQGASSNWLGNLLSPWQGGVGGGLWSETAITSITLIDGNNSINNDFGFVKPYDLAITKTSNIGTGTSDTVVAYTITYANIGWYPVNDVNVTDIWPSTLIDFIGASIAPSATVASW
jgi:uncharacterized repeat protein (TIGR01451 family)